MEFKYPRVSEILAPYSNISLANVPKDTLEHAASRGTTIHSYCTAYARGDFVPPIAEEYKPYLDGFISWYDANVESLSFSEKRLYHEELQYCGQPDLVVKLKGKYPPVLVDIKSSYKIYQTHPVQLAAYLTLLEANKIDACDGIILHLKKDGTAKAHDYGDCNEYQRIFMYAVKLYNYFLRAKVKKTKVKK